METVIINAHVIDSRNIGDLASSPTKYFDFKHRVETLDIRSIDPKFSEPKSGFGGSITLEEIKNNANKVKYHLIVGGGGLLFRQFMGSFEAMEQLKSVFNGKWIAWGVGQQIYSSPKSAELNLIDSLLSDRDKFDYHSYLKNFEAIGIRDTGFQYDWVPCASCMHPTFDQPRDIKHDFVVFSHRKFQIKIDGFPRMTHDTQSLEEVINFLGSGETIITSSYHGAYWGTLLGRKVIAFPFSTKFLTLKHPPTIYPVSQWKYSRFKFRPFKKTFLNKINLEFNFGNKYTCKTDNWRELLSDCQTYPHILEEYRKANLTFYQQVKQLLTADT
jgi:hypothetical protein